MIPESAGLSPIRGVLSFTVRDILTGCPSFQKKKLKRNVMLVLLILFCNERSRTERFSLELKYKRHISNLELTIIKVCICAV